jgi:hypothetical protein
MQNREYFDSVMCDLADLRDGEKSLLIVSSGKDTLAYETATMLAERWDAVFAVNVQLRCEDGQIHEHVFISYKYATVRRALDQIEDCKAGKITRPQLQFELGQLLGYTMRDTLDFIASAVSRECPCDCCGGPFVDERYTG